MLKTETVCLPESNFTSRKELLLNKDPLINIKHRIKLLICLDSIEYIIKTFHGKTEKTDTEKIKVIFDTIRKTYVYLKYIFENIPSESYIIDYKFIDLILAQPTKDLKPAYFLELLKINFDNYYHYNYDTLYSHYYLYNLLFTIYWIGLIEEEYNK